MAWWMYLLLMIYCGASLILIGVILLQSGKGGGLSSLGASNQGLAEALGATGAERTLMKLTTYCAVTFIVLSLVISLFSAKALNRTNSIIGNVPEAAAPVVPGGAQTGQDTPGTDVPPGAPGIPPAPPISSNNPIGNPAASAPSNNPPAPPVNIPAAPAPAQ